MQHNLMPSHPTNKTPVSRQIVEIDGATAVELIREQIAALRLNLSGLTVVAGAGRGYQAIVAAAAALAGASHVLTFFRGSKGHGNAAGAAGATLAFARYAGVAGCVETVDRISSRQWHDVDILVSSFQLGPISRSIIELLPSHAVIALMAEPWEIEPRIIDIDACEEAGVKVAAPNYGHPAVGMYRELARLCRMLVEEAGIDLDGALLAVLCDTPLAPFIERALRSPGAKVSVFPHPLLLPRDNWDAIVVAMRPSAKPTMNINCLGRIRENAGNALLVQFSGEIDRSAASYFGLSIWPPKSPGRGQVGLPLDALGPEPGIRKLMTGLKAAEAAYRHAQLGRDAIGDIVTEEDWHK